MQIPEDNIGRLKIRIRLYPDGRRSSWGVGRYPELNKKTFAVLASKGTGSRYIKPWANLPLQSRPRGAITIKSHHLHRTGMQRWYS